MKTHQTQPKAPRHRGRALVALCCLLAIAMWAQTAPANAIVNGTIATETDPRFAAMVAVGSGCGGTLIDEIWVLTAAHCVYDDSEPGDTIDPAALSLRLGPSHRSSPGRTLTADFVRKHPNFDGKGLVPTFLDTSVDLQSARDDIALIRLDAPVTGVAPVALRTTMVPDGAPFTLAGWGNTRYVPPFSSADRSEELRFIAATTNRTGLLCSIADAAGLLCGVGTGAGCAGDSGGGMIVGNRIAGVFTIGDCQTHSSGVPIASQLGFINGTIAAFSAALPPTCDGHFATIIGTSGNDVLTGTSGSDVIVGLAGRDTIDGLADDDWICAGPGNDTVTGGRHDDYIEGNDGADTIAGQWGADTILGGDGRDEIRGGTAVDTINGGGDRDHIWGGDGRDILNGDGGSDVIRGGKHRDTINGGDGDDDIFGDEGGDELFGDDGHDDIRGNAGADDIFGGDDNDIMRGGTGQDDLVGDAGNDVARGGHGSDTCSAETQFSC